MVANFTTYLIKFQQKQTSIQSRGPRVVSFQAFILLVLSYHQFLYFETKNSFTEVSTPLRYWTVTSARSKTEIETSINLTVLGPDYMLGVALIQYPQVPGNYFGWIVLQQKSSLSVKQCQVFLLHSGIHPFQLFGLKVGIDSSSPEN